MIAEPFIAEPLRRCLHRADQNIFLLVTLFFVLGIITAHSPSFALAESLSTGAVLVFAGSIFAVYRKKKTSSPLALLLILPFFFLLGNLVLLHRLQQPQAAGHIATLLREQQQVTLGGTLETMVEESVFQQDGQEVITSRFDIKAEEVLARDSTTNWQPVHGRVRLFMQGRADNLQPGMALMIPAKVGPVIHSKTPGVFNYREYLAAQNIFLTGRVLGKRVTVLKEQEQAGVVSNVVRAIRSLRFLPEQVRQQVSRFIRDTLPRPVAGTYQALLIGSRTGVPKEIQEQFKAAGTMHLLAISGLHMGLLAFMIGAIISRLLRRSEQLLLRIHVPTLTVIVTLPVLFGYSFIAGMNIPVLRALVMTLVFFFAFMLRRQHSLLHLPAVAVLIVLTCNPLALFSTSFQLSFSAVIALVLFLPTILPSFSAASSGSEGEIEEKTIRRSRLIRLWQGFILPAFLVSFVASLGVLPCMLLHFHRFSLIGPVMTLLVEPCLCLWALPWGLAAIPCMFVAPQAAVVLLKIGALGIRAGHYCTAIGAALPWASVWTITPTAVEVLCYGLLLLLWFLSLKMGRFRRTARSTVIVGAFLLALHFTWGLFFPEPSGFSTVSYLDVGQGSSGFLRSADGSCILIDGGGNKNSRINVGEQVIAPYLWRQRVWRLEQAVITHPHSDHFNGMDFILARFRPKKLFVNGDPRIEGNYQEIIDQAVRQGTAVIRPASGYTMEKIEKYGEAALTILSGAVQTVRATQQGRGSVNDASLVLRYRHGKRAFLFPGDIEKAKEAVLLEKQVDMTADVLLAPHHGSSTSSSSVFIKAVAPALIIVSAGKDRKYFPAPINLAAWEEQGIPVAVTGDQGTISCTTDGDELRCLDFAGKVVYATARYNAHGLVH
jgi:competence protein ComEC